MPRIRTLKPEFFRSPDTAKVDFPVRIFYQALWCWADDFGIGETNINGLLGFAFPDEDEFTAQDLRRFCADCAQHFQVTFYTVRGRHYYAIPTWEKHQKLERRTDRRKHPLPDDPDAVPDQRFQPSADSARFSRGLSGAESALEQGKGNRGKGTGEQDDDAPDHIETAAKPSKRFASSSSKTLVRQSLGQNDYPRATIERLGIQVDKLLHEGCPDTAIREAVQEWDRRPNCEKPEFLPTVYGDVVKRSRAINGVSPGEAKVLGWLALAEPNPDERKALGQ